MVLCSFKKMGLVFFITLMVNFHYMGVMFTKIMIRLHVLQLENLKNKPGNKPDVA